MAYTHFKTGTFTAERELYAGISEARITGLDFIPTGFMFRSLTGTSSNDRYNIFAGTEKSAFGYAKSAHSGTGSAKIREQAYSELTLGTTIYMKFDNYDNEYFTNYFAQGITYEYVAWREEEE